MLDRVIIAGGRDFDDYELLKEACENFLEDGGVIVVSGCARGADTLGQQWALENSLMVYEYPAQWDIYGKRAGFLRNESMAAVSDILVAFWNGESKGTKHMIDIALREGLDVHVYRY